MHNWSTFGARTNHGNTWIHKTHHNLDLREAMTFPLIVFFVISHGGCTQMSFFSKVSKFVKLKLLVIWKPIISFRDLRLRWGLKQSCSLCWDLSNNIWDAMWTHLIQGDFWLLVIGSEIDNLTTSPYFGHNLCCKYSNGPWEPILDINILKSFQWYKEIFYEISFDSSNCFLNIQYSIGTLTPKVEVHLGVCGLIPSHFFALLKVWMWLPSCTFNLHPSMPKF
jgi:hypothetical protein